MSPSLAVRAARIGGGSWDEEAPTGPPDATFTWEDAILVEIPYGLIDRLALGYLPWIWPKPDRDPTGTLRIPMPPAPFAYVEAYRDECGYRTVVSYIYGPDRRACSAHLKPSMRLLRAWRDRGRDGVREVVANLLHEERLADWLP